jgi:amino acid adenylation domain-containing protein
VGRFATVGSLAAPEESVSEMIEGRDALSADTFLERLRALDVRVWVEGDRLRCSAPAGVLTAALKEELGWWKPHLLGLLNGSERVTSPVIPVLADRATYTASFAQERMWFLQQLAPASTAYIVGGAARVTGALDTDVLRACWEELANRHELLHARFLFVDEALSVGLDGERPAFELIDLRGCPKPQRMATMERVGLANRDRTFDLERGPVARLTVYQFDDEQVLALGLHHTIADFWSLGVVIRDLSTLYTARLRGMSPGWTLPPVRYVDYAAWHRQWMSGSAWEHEWAFWRTQFSGARPLNLPTDRPRPVTPTLAGDTLISPISEALRSDIVTFSRNQSATVYMTLMTALAALMVRYTGQTDFVIGAPVAGRQHQDCEQLVGPFINTLAIRIRADGNSTLRQLLGQVRSAVLDAQAHQDAPFERLLAAAQPARHAAHQPLVQVMLNGVGGPRDFDFAGLKAQAVVSGWKTSLVDLTFFVDLEQTSLLVAEYSTEMFERTTVEQLVSYYIHVIEELARNPDQRLNQLMLMGVAERERIITEWNETAREFPAAQSVVDLFEARVADAPERIAVVDSSGARLTYRELDARANALAVRLQTLGVAPDTLVGVGVDRSVNLLVATLGVWKAGGAYVPLDPAYPKARLDYMLADSGASVIVTDSHLREMWSGSDLSIVCVDDPLTPADPPRRQTRADHLAYVIYTSGSTGKPKGVEIPHAAFINFLRSVIEEPGITADDVVLAVTTLSFDIAGLELYAPLISGGRVELASREDAADGRTLLARIASAGVSLLQATPATWQLLLSAGWTRTPGLRALCGGEALSRELANQVLDRADALWNMYGPTETTVWSTMDRVTRDVPIAIGRPMANTRVYVLDSALQPVPVGVTGELFIAGAGIARGYHDRPELTRERFVQDPFQVGTEGRLYRTGDLARWRADGRIECLGRVDQQVKVRGFRIELGEIETALEQHPSIRQAVVSVYEPAPGDRRLAAYVVGNAGAPAADAVLRSHLREVLAEYMVPSVFVPLTSLPLTDNGKVDRNALPTPETARTTVAVNGGKPKTEIERTIAGIWADVLRISDVPIHANFFDLGGHSLLFAQVQSRLEQRLERKISMLDLFQFPTVSALATRLSPSRPEPARTSDARRRAARQLAALGEAADWRVPQGEVQ